MKVLIFSNCQGSVLNKFLPETFTINYISNYTYIYNTTLDENIKILLSECDFFIYQPIISTIYPIYNTNNLKKYLKSTCKIISFPYIYINSFTPIYKCFTHDYFIGDNNNYFLNTNEKIKYCNIEPIIKLKKEGFSLEKILEKYDLNEIDFCYKDRFEQSISILKDKETFTDVKVSQFILDNYKKFKLFNYHNLIDKNITFCNHPSNLLIIYYVNQILNLMGLNYTNYNGKELLIETTLVSRYDIDFYKYEYIQVEDDKINESIKQIISEIYEKF